MRLSFGDLSARIPTAERGLREDSMREAETLSCLGWNVLPVFHQKREKTAECPQRGFLWSIES